MTIRGLVRNLVSAVSDEIAAQRRGGSRAFILYNGRPIGGLPGSHLYEFDVGLDLNFPDEARCQVQIQGRRYLGVSHGCHQGILALGFEQELEGPLTRVTLRCEPWYLLEQQRERLLEIMNQKTSLNQSLVLEAFTKSQSSSAVDAHLMAPGLVQFDENKLSSGDGVSHIWGPPGTGKTRVSGRIVRGRVDVGETVLAVAHSNVATDMLTQSIAGALQGTRYLAAGECLRVGPPRLEEVRALGQVIPREILRWRYPTLLREIEELERQIAEIGDRLHRTGLEQERPDLQRRLRLLRQRLEPLRGEYTKLEGELMSNARVVVTTLTRMCMCNQVFGRSFRSVLIDEVSMATSAAVAVAVARAEKRATLVGDFKQLGPVVLARSRAAKKWLSRDMFQVAGVTKNVESGRFDPRLHTLTVQHRMYSRLRSFLNDLFYDGILTDGDEVEAETAPIVALQPMPGQAIVMCDMGRMRGRCYRENGRGSHFNIAAAITSVEMARRSIDSGAQSVALISPYLAQAKLLALLVRDTGMDRRVQVGTIHRIQGGQFDVVVCDLVDTAPLTQPGLPLRGGMNSAAARLLNVGFSRGRGKLVIVGDLQFLGSTGRQDSVLRRALALIPESSVTEFTPSLTDNAVSNERRIVWFTEQTMPAALSADLRTARSNVLVNTTTGSLFQAFDPQTMAQMVNQRASVGFAAPQELAPQHLQDDFVFEEPRSPEQLAVIEGVAVWYRGMFGLEDRGGMYARIPLQNSALVLAEMTGLAEMLPLPQAPIGAIIDAAMANLGGQLPPQEAVAREIVLGRRRLNL